jgi:hypothetical protein
MIAKSNDDSLRVSREFLKKCVEVRDILRTQTRFHVEYVTGDNRDQRCSIARNKREFFANACKRSCEYVATDIANVNIRQMRDSHCEFSHANY